MKKEPGRGSNQATVYALREAGAPGYRNLASGELTNVGNEGSVWSGSFSGTNGRYLNFNSTWLNPENANNRAYGFQVRCLQAFIARSRFHFEYFINNFILSRVPECPRL